MELLELTQQHMIPAQQKQKPPNSKDSIRDSPFSAGEWEEEDVEECLRQIYSREENRRI